MNYTNNSNISLALAVFLATDDYDHVPNTISATSLMKSTRQYILSKRIPAEEQFTDISTLVPSRLGTAVHTGIEAAWNNPNLDSVLEQLGYPKRVYDNVIINPTKPQLTPDSIPIYMEIRSFKDILGFRVSGKFDFVGDGQVQDFKNTSVWKYIKQSGTQDYIVQMSIYRLLNPEIITADTAVIHFIFTDWSKLDSFKTKGYPPMRVHSQTLNLMSPEQTMKYIKDKLKAIVKYEDSHEVDIPHCTDVELWRSASVYKYYKDPTKTSGKSTRTENTQSEALAHYIKGGSVGVVIHVPGQAKACGYCPAFSRCSQKDALIANGELSL